MLMRTKIVRIGNSQGIILNKSLLQQYGLKEEVEIHPQENGLLITPLAEAPRQGWDQQFKDAIAAGHLPESAMLEGFSNHFEEDEWQW